MRIQIRPEPTSVFAAANRCFVLKQNTTRALDGPVSTPRPMKPPWKLKRIPAMACGERKSSAAGVRPIWGMFSTMAHNLRDCATALILWHWSSSKTKKRRPGRDRGAFYVLILKVQREGNLCSCAGTRHHFGDRVAFPHPEQQHFRAARVFEHVVRVRKALYFIETR